MNYVLKHLEKAIDEMTEVTGSLIYLVKHGDETATNYMEIFTSIYTDMLALYGLMSSQNRLEK